MENLWKALRGGSRFALRSCCRLRARGSGARSTAPDGSESLAGTVRFEALVPDLSFRACQIKPIPILATPLTKLLTNPNQPLTDASMGYISMNRTRKLVFAQETEAESGWWLWSLRCASCAVSCESLQRRVPWREPQPCPVGRV